MVNIVEGECLLKRKQVLGAVGTGERFFDRLSTGVATVIAQAGQRLGVTLSGEDCADDPQTGRAGDVGNDVVELKISSLVNAFCMCWICEAAYSSRRSPAHARMLAARRSGLWAESWHAADHKNEDVAATAHR